MSICPTTDLKKILLFCCLIMVVLTAQAQSEPILNPSNCGLNLTIPDSTCNTSNRFRINVDRVAGARLGSEVFVEEVRLIVAHSWIADLDISLTSPNGVKVELTTDNGEDEDNYGDPSDVTCGNYISFSPSACNSITDIETPPFVGEYRPEGNLLDFNDESDPNGQWILEICDDAGDDAGTLEFVELVFSPVICLAPSELSILSTDSTTVEIDWRSGSTCENTIIEYGLPGFAPGSNASAGSGGTVVIADCPPYALQGLQPYTTYEVYIRELCSNGNFSANSCPIVIETSCLPPPITLIETFDNQELCNTICGNPCEIQGVWKNQNASNFDWIIHTGATPSANTGPSGDVENDGNYLYIETSGTDCRDGKVAYLISNCVEVNTGGFDSCHFSFNYHLFGASIGRLTLEISTDGGGNWSKIWEKRGNQGNRWYKQYLSLSEWDGQVVRFRFVGESGSNSTGDLAIDNLVFYGTRDFGVPENIFYADTDEDGYGDANNFIESCSAIVPAGFVTNDLDCKDNNPNINPDAEEIPCNDIDENCNGIEDDRIIAAPTTTNAAVCSGEMATVFAEVPEGGFILWFASPDSTDFLAFDEGQGYSELFESINGIVQKTVYAEARQGIECISATRTPTTITVYPKPELAVASPPAICPGEQLDLSSLTLADENSLNGTITYHTALPATPENQLNDLIIAPEMTSTYYILSTTPQACQDVVALEVRVGGEAAVSITPSDTLSICAGSVQTLEAIAEDTSIAYSYVWSTGEVGNSIKIEGSSTAGEIDAYSVMITAPTGCATFDTVWVRASTGIESARVVPQEVTICGGSDGEIFVEPLSGTAPFSYYWSGTSSGNALNVDGNYTIENLEQGTYRITVVDNSSLGCDIQLPLSLVNGPNAKVSLASTTPVSCDAASDGEICIDIQGGAPQIIWSNGATTSCTQNLSSGKYSVTVTDGNCETILSDIEVGSPSPIQIASILTTPTCSDENDGNIEISTSGGTAPYRYAWQDIISETEDRSNLVAGAYILTILDANNCSFIDTLLLDAPDSLQITGASIQNTSCADIENGQIIPTVTGGTAPYFYEWNNGSFNDTLVNLTDGIYALTITDVNGCQTQNSFEIESPEALTLQLDSLRNTTCEGLSDGLIRVNVSGGSSSYAYQWSNGSQENEIDSLLTGTYVLTVFDENGCRLIDSFFVAAPPSIALSSTIKNPKCVGSKDGAINLTISNTNAATFEWNNARITEDIDRISNGEYSVTVTDENGCTLDTSFVLTAPQLLDVSITTRAPSCAGSRDGSIQLEVTNENGLPPDYRWSNDRRTKDLMNIGAGTYTAIIKDLDGCTFETDTIFIRNPEPIVIIADQITAVQCADERSGSIEVSVSGGNAPYEYNWSNSDKNKDLFDVSAGNYRLAVLDENGCAAESELFRISAPPSINLSYRIVQNELCQVEGGRVDSVILNVSGGRPGYTYRWSTNATTRNLTNIEAGDYSVTVEDQNGCKASIPSIKIKPPGNGLAAYTRKENVRCNNTKDGSIFASISGGTAPFIYHLSSGKIITQDTDSILFAQLEPGNYNLTITDANGCSTISRNLFLTEPTPIQVTTVANGIQNVKCAGGSDGSIDLNISGGTRPYTYLWQNSSGEMVSDSQDLRNVGAGTYTFSIMDANGCSIMPSTYVVRSPSFPIAFSNVKVTPVQCFGGNSGEIKLSLSGGVAPYEYSWNNGLYTSKNISNIPAGYYQLAVTDANDCVQLTDSILVLQAEKPIQLKSEEVLTTRCHDTNDGYISVEVEGGFPPYQLFWESSDPNNNYVNGDVQTVDDVPPGNYVLSVVDSVACSATFSFKIEQPEQLKVTSTSTPEQSNRSNGSAAVLVAGGIQPYSYSWSIAGSADTSRLDGLAKGIYFVTIIDARDCQIIAAVEVKNDPTDATNDLDKIAQLQFHPNPVQNFLHLELAFPQPEDILLRIYSTQGVRLLEQWEKGVLKKEWSLDVSGFAAGAYFLQIRTLDGRSLGRVFLKME